MEALVEDLPRKGCLIYNFLRTNQRYVTNWFEHRTMDTSIGENHSVLDERFHCISVSMLFLFKSGVKTHTGFFVFVLYLFLFYLVVCLHCCTVGYCPPCVVYPLVVCGCNLLRRALGTLAQTAEEIPRGIRQDSHRQNSLHCHQLFGCCVFRA